MNKKIKTMLGTLLLTSAMSVTAYAEDMKVDVNGVSRIFTDVVEVETGEYASIDLNTEANILLVKASELADYLQLIYSTSDSFVGVEESKKDKEDKVDEEEVIENIVVIQNHDYILEIDTNTLEAKFNGEDFELPKESFVDEDGELFLPMRFIVTIFDKEMNFNFDKNMVEIDYETEYYSDLYKINNIAKDTDIYTFTEARKKAKENSYSLIKNEVTMKKTKDDIRGINVSLNYYYNFYISNNIVNNEHLEQLIDAREQLDEYLEAQEMQKEIAEFDIELGLITAMDTLNSAKAKYITTTESLRFMEKQLEFAKLKNEFGMASDDDVVAAERNVANLNMALETVENSIIVAERNLNDIIGLELDESIYLIYDIEVEPNDIDLEAMIRKGVNESYSVDKARDDAEKDFETYEDNGLEKEDTSLYVVDAENKAEKDIRETYNNLNTVIENDAKLRADRDDAIKKYNVGVINYEAGYMTKYQLEALYNNIATAETDILSNELAYATLMLRFKYPQLF